VKESEQAIFRARENVVATDIDGGQVLLDLDNGQYFSLNGTASIVWQGISESKNRAEIVQQILRLYDIDEERCGHDVSAIIEALCSSNLVEEVRENS